MKTADFTMAQAPGQADLLASLAEQQRLQQLLAALEEAPSNPGTVKTGAYNVLNLSPMIDALKEKRLSERLAGERKKGQDAQAKYQEELLRQLRLYEQTRAGTPQELQGPTPDGAPLMGRKPNPQAYRQFLNSPFPQIAGMAKSEGEAQQKLFEKLLERSDFGSAQAAAGDPHKLVPKENWQFVDGLPVRTREGQMPTLPPGMRYGQETGPQGAIINRNPFTNKTTGADQAPRIIMPGDNLLKKKIDQLPEEQKIARGMANTLRGTETALNALANGARAGYGEDFFQNARTLVGGLTGIKFDATTPTAVLAKELAQNVLNEFGGNLGTGVSNTDVKFMEMASGGSATDPTALERILAIRAATAFNRLREYSDQVEAIGGVKGNDYGPEGTKRLFGVTMPNFRYKFKTPEASASFESIVANRPYDDVYPSLKGEYSASKAAPTGPAAPTIDDLVNKHLGKRNGNPR